MVLLPKQTYGPVAAQLVDLLSKGLNELLVMLVPVANPESEQTQLMRLIGQL